MFPGISSCDNFTARGLGVLPAGYNDRGDGTATDANGNVYNLSTGTLGALIGYLNPDGSWTDVSGVVHPLNSGATAIANSWVLPVVIGVAALWLLSRNK